MSRFENTWRIEVLLPSGTTQYFDGTDLTPNRDDALNYSDIVEVVEDYRRLCEQGLDASIEVSKRFTGHSAASRLERFYATTLHSIAAE